MSLAFSPARPARPLSRVALAAIGSAIAALAITGLEPARADASRYVLIYAFALLLSVLIVVGHLLIGLGVWSGVSSLAAYSEGEAALGTTSMNVIEAVFVIICLLASTFLWRGRMEADLSNTV